MYCLTCSKPSAPHKLCFECYNASKVLCTGGCNSRVPPHITPETCRVCQRMKERKFINCTDCGSFIRPRSICPTCYKRAFIKCVDCGNMYHPSTRCQRCYDASLVPCSECGTNKEPSADCHYCRVTQLCADCGVRIVKGDPINTVCIKCFNKVYQISGCDNNDHCRGYYGSVHTRCDKCTEFIKSHGGINNDYFAKVTLGDGIGTICGGSCLTPQGDDDIIEIDNDYDLPVFNDMVVSGTEESPDLDMYNKFKIPEAMCDAGGAPPETICCNYTQTPRVVDVKILKKIAT